jgi:transposase
MRLRGGGGGGGRPAKLSEDVVDILLQVQRLFGNATYGQLVEVAKALGVHVSGESARLVSVPFTVM